MFVTVEIEDENTGLKEKIRDLFYPPNVQLEQVALPNGKSFFNLKVKKYRGIIPWHTMQAAVQKHKNAILLPSSLKIPDEMELKKYTSKVLKSRLLFNSSLKVIKTMALDPLQLYVCVVDENAYMIDLVEKLVPFVNGIRIVSSCVCEYEKLAEKLMREYGISIIITTKIDQSVLSSTIIISNKSAEVPLVFSGLLLSNEKKPLMHGTSLIGHGIKLSESYLKLCPSGIDQLEFACALYELCAVDEIGTMQYIKMVSSAKLD